MQMQRTKMNGTPLKNPTTMDDPTLSDKQARFVQEYLVDCNATQALIRAGYAPKSASVVAAQTLIIPKVARALRKAKEELQARTQISQDAVLREYATIAFQQVDPKRVPIRWADKLSALDSLAKHLGLFIDRHEISGKDGAPLSFRVTIDE